MPRTAHITRMPYPPEFVELVRSILPNNSQLHQLIEAKDYQEVEWEIDRERHRCAMLGIEEVRSALQNGEQGINELRQKVDKHAALLALSYEHIRIWRELDAAVPAYGSE